MSLETATEAAQDAAMKALGKRFVRSAEEPDAEAYRMQLHALGFADDVRISFMLTGWMILREERADVPEPVASRAAATETEPASDRQWAFLRQLADEKGFAAPSGPLTKAQASEAISALQSGTYDPDKYDVPF